MKKLLLGLLLFLGALSVQAQEIRWMSLDEALARQKKNPKPIFMEVYTDWYSQCKMFETNTLQHPEVSELINRNYYAVKFNAEGNSVVNYKGASFLQQATINGTFSLNDKITLTNKLKPLVQSAAAHHHLR